MDLSHCHPASLDKLVIPSSVTAISASSILNPNRGVKNPKVSFDSVRHLKIKLVDVSAQVDYYGDSLLYPSEPAGFTKLQYLQVHDYLKLAAQRPEAFDFVAEAIISENPNLTSLTISFPDPLVIFSYTKYSKNL